MSGETSPGLLTASPLEAGAAVSTANTGRAPAPTLDLYGPVLLRAAVYLAFLGGCSQHGETTVSCLSVGIETLWSCHSTPTAFWTESSQFPHVTMRCWL